MKCPSCGHEWRHLRAGLTLRENQLLTVLEERAAQTRVGPSYEELVTALGLKSKSSVHRLVQQLVAKGWLQQPYGKHRRALTIIPHVP